MYYPYLRGLQFELIALRELAKESGVADFVCPILEPVKSNLSSLTRVRDEFYDACEWHPYLILNPSVGELSREPEPLTTFYSEERTKRVFRPALILPNEATGLSVEYLIRQSNLKDVMIICLEYSASRSAMSRILEMKEVSAIVMLNPSRNRGLDRSIRESGKTYIRLDDLFVPEKNNAAYLDIPPHKFTEEHLYYKTDGFSGYSDFTLLPMSFQTGGWTPKAVVIHWSYLDKNNQEIWVRHFTSESNLVIANIQGKFAEVARKVSDANDCGDLSQNRALEELLTYYGDKRYPGLGVLKKLSIENHILINCEYLRTHGAEE